MPQEVLRTACAALLPGRASAAARERPVVALGPPDVAMVWAARAMPLPGQAVGQASCERAVVALRPLVMVWVTHAVPGQVFAARERGSESGAHYVAAKPAARVAAAVLQVACTIEVLSAACAGAAVRADRGSQLRGERVGAALRATRTMPIGHTAILPR